MSMDRTIPDPTDANADLERLKTEIERAEHRLRLTLDAAGTTGGWEWDIVNKTLRGDAAFAAFMQLDSVELSQGIATSNFFRNIHADDRKRVQLAVAGIM